MSIWRIWGTKSFADELSSRWVWPAVIFFIALVGYVIKLPQTVSFEDSAEFVTVAAALGIPHPSGYPLYVLLSHVMTWLPWGTVPWRVAFLSALAAAGAVALAFVVVRQLLQMVRATAWWQRLVGARSAGIGGDAIVAAALLTWGFSATWWSQAIYAKVYPLHALLCLLATWAALRVGDSARRAGFFGVTVGAALSVHLYLVAVIVPFWLAAVLWSNPVWRRPSRLWWFFLVGALIGLLPYLYLPWRYAHGAPFAMDTLGSPADFWDFVTRQRYGDVGGAAWNKFGLIGSALYRPLTELGPLFVGLAAVGMAGLWRRRSSGQAAAVILVGLFLAAPLASLLRSVGWTPENEYLTRVYGLTGVLAMALMATVGAAALADRAAASRRRYTLGLVVCGFFLLPVLSVWSNGAKLWSYRDAFVENYGRALLAGLPNEAVLVVNDPGTVGDTELFTIAYLQVVEGVRRDVTVVQDAGISNFFTPQLPAEYLEANLAERRRLMLEAVRDDISLEGRPLFTTFAPDYLGEEWQSVPSGVVFGVHGAAATPIAVEGFSYGSADCAELPLGYAALVSHLAYVQAAREQEAGEKRRSGELLSLAIACDAYPFSDDYRGFVAARGWRSTDVD